MDSQTIRTALGTLQSNPDDTDAWSTLGRALGESAGDLDPAAAIELMQAAIGRHAERGEWPAVAQLLELAAEVRRDEPDEANYLRQLARVADVELFDQRRAVAAFTRLLEIEPGDAVATSFCEEAATKAESWQDLAANYSSEADGASDEVYESAMLMRAAETEFRFSDNPGSAELAERLERSVRLDPTNAAAAKLLENVYRSSDKWEAAARVLERAADRSPDAEMRVATGIRLARLYLHHLSDPERAARAYDRVLVDAPNQPDAVKFVTDFYSSNERWDSLVRVYERLLTGDGAAQRSEGARVGDMLQIAMLHWRKREAPADAEVWFEQIRRIDPANDGMLAFYREYKRSLDDDAGLVSILKTAQRVMNSEDPRKAEVEQELSALVEAQATAQESIEEQKSALRQNPDDEEARDSLKRLYKQTQGHNALVELLRQQLERTPEESYEQRLEILREIAGVYREYIKSDTALVSVLHQIVQLDGKLDEHDVEEVRELCALYAKLGRWRDLLTHQQLLAELVRDVEEKKSLYRQVATRWLDQFSNVQHAMEAFAALHALDPSDEEATERLEELYRKRRAWKELYGLYEEQLAQKEGADRAPLLREMAVLAAERLNRSEDAIGFYREILDLEPGRTDVLDKLEKQAERAKDWPTVAEALERRLSTLHDPPAQLAVLQKLGGVYADHVGDIEQATGAWRRVLEIEPRQARAMRVLRDTFLRLQDFDQLEELYASQQDPEGLAEVLSTGADRAKEVEVKIDLSYRAAAVYENMLGQPDRAFRSYERVLSANPNDVKAAERLLPLYEADEKWSRMPALLEVILANTEDPDEQVTISERLVEIAGHRLSDRKGAAHYARRAYENFPADPRTLELLEKASRAAGQYDDLVSALEARYSVLLTAAAEQVVPSEAPPSTVESTPPSPGRGRGRGKGRSRRRKKASEAPPPAAAATKIDVTPELRLVALKLAAVYSQQMAQPDAAAEKLSMLVEHDPGDDDAAAALEAILRQADRRDDLRRLFERRTEHAPSPEARVRLLDEWAKLEEDVFGDSTRALATYKRVLETDPDDREALSAVVRLSLAAEDWAGAAVVLERQRDLAIGDEKGEKSVALATLYLERLNRPAEAFEAALGGLDASVSRSQAIGLLQKLIEYDETKADSARVLSEQYGSQGDARQEAAALAALIDETADADEQIALYERLIAIYEEKLDEPSGALDVVLAALGRHPTVIHLWERAAHLAVMANRPTHLADRYRETLRGELSAEITRDLSQRAASLHEDVLGDPIGAIPHYERLLKLDPDDAIAFERLKEILTAAERWGELESLYERATARIEDNTRKADLLSEVAMIADEIMDQPEKASAFYEKILELEPTHRTALQALDRIYTRLGKKEELGRVLERRLELADADDLDDLRVRYATLMVDLFRPERAIEHVEQVLESDPNHFEAREVAERLIDIGIVRLRAARALELVYETRDEVRDLVRVLGVRIDELRPSDGNDEDLSETERQEREDERRDLLRRVATLRDDRLHDDEGSFEVFAELAPLDPMDIELRERLAESGRRLGRNDRVAEVLAQTAEAAEDARLKGEILMQLAALQSNLLAQTDQAEASYRQVLELDPDDPDLVLPAARALEEIYTASGRPADLAGVLEVQVRLEVDSLRRNELLARLGQLQSDVLGSAEKAISAWERRLEEAPDDAKSLQALDALYASEERYEDLVRVLERRRDLATDEGTRRELLLRQAETHREKMGRPSEAIDSYQMLLDEFGPDEAVFTKLEELFEAAERWDELNDVLERHLEIAVDLDVQLATLTRVGNLRRRHLDDFAGALDAYRRALTTDPQHAPSRSALEEMLELEDPIVRSEAAEILHPIYEVEGNYGRLLHVVDIEIEVADDPQVRLEKLDAASRIAEDALEDARRAFTYAKRSVREAVGVAELNTRLQSLERLASVTGQRAEQVEVLDAIAPEVFDGDLQIEVIRRVGELHRTELDDREQAISAYQRALELRADDQASLRALEQLYTEASDDRNLLDILERQGEAAESDQERKALSFRRAELLSEKLEEPERAIEVYEGILDLGLDRRAVDALSALYTGAERWDDLSALMQRQIDEGADDVATLRVRLATIAVEKQHETDRALDELEQALDIDSQHQGAVMLLEKLKESAPEDYQKSRAAALLEPVYMVRADWDLVMSVLETRLRASDDPEERRELINRIAQIHEEQKEDYVGALEVSAQLLQDDLGDESTIAELERLSKVAGAEKRLAEIYAKRVETVDVDDEASARLCRRAGELFAATGEGGRALALYRRALAFFPENDELFRAIDSLLIASDAHADRVELYRQGLEHRFEPETQVRFLHTIADLERSELGLTEESIETYRAVLEIDELDEVALDALTELYRDTERWDDLAELYQRRAEMGAPAESVPHRLALAELFRTKLESPERAIDQLEEVVRELPENSEAISMLEAFRADEAHKERVVEILRPLYESADDWRHLVKLNEDRFSLADDPHEKVGVLRETAELWEVRGDDAPRARRVLAQALRLNPDDVEVREDYERLVELTDAWSELAEVYGEILETHSDLMSRRDFLERRAETFDTRLDEPRQALDTYVALHEVDLGELEPVEHVEKLSLLLSDWQVLVKALEAKTEIVFDEEERADAWRRMGEVRRFMLEDSDGAVEAYERAFEIDHTHAPTSDRLIDLYEQRNDSVRLVDLYQQRIDIATDDEAELRHELLMRAARRFEGELEDRPRAIEALNRALSIQPNDGDTLQRLNRLYRDEEMWPELLDNLRLQASTAQTVDERVELRKQVGTILAERLDSHEEAIDAYRLVLDEAPGDTDVIRAVTDLAKEHEHLRSLAGEVLVPVLRQGGHSKALVETLELRLTVEVDPAVRSETLREIARIEEHELDSKESAFESLLRAMAETPEVAELHGEAERLAGETKLWGQYVDALEAKAAETFEPELARDLWVRAGRFAEERLEDVPRAIEAYNKAAEQVGDQVDLLDALDRLYTKAGQTDDLRMVLERRMALADTDEARADLYFKLGRLDLEQLSNEVDALSNLRTALDLDRNHEGASRLLEKLLEDESMFDEVFQILEDVYRDRGQTDRLAALHERRVAKAETAEERLEMRRGLARVLEDDCNDPGAAQKILQQGLLDDPTNFDLQMEVERLAAITNDWSGAANALVDAVTKSEDLPDDAGRDLCVRAAGWQRDKAGDREAAEAAYLAAAKFDPHSDEILEEVEQLQRGEGREGDLVRTLRRRAALAVDDEGKLEKLREAAALSERAGDSALREEVLREILDLTPDDEVTLAGLTDVRRAAGDHAETFDLLMRRIVAGNDPASIRPLRLEAAEIARQHLNDVTEATGLYEALFDEEPADPAVAAELRALYGDAERFEDQARLIERLIDVAPETRARNQLRIELADLKLTRLDDADSATELLRSVLTDEPGNAQAALTLGKVFEDEKRYADLAELLEEQVKMAAERGDAAAELEVLERLGVIYEEQMGDAERAIGSYDRIVATDPSRLEALEALVRLHSAAGDKVSAAAVTERILPLLEGDVALARHQELAALYKEQGQAESAIAVLERAMALAPADTELRDALRTEYEATSAWEKLAGMYVADAESAGDDARKVALFRKAAQIHADKREDHAEAAALLARASEVATEDRDLMLELCDAYSASGRGNEAVEVLQKIVESFGGKRSKELGEIHRRLANAYLSQGNAEQAIEELEKAFRIEPGNVHVLKRLGEVALEAGDLQKAQKMFRALLLQRLDADTPITKAEVFLRLGQVHEKLGEKPKAKQMYERALQQDSDLVAAKDALAAL